MGLLSKITRSITKPFKKVLKSDLGKLALGLGAYYYGPAALQPGKGLRGLSGWQKALTAKAPWLYTAGEASVPGVPDVVTGKGTSASGILGKAANTWRGMSGLQKAATVGVGAAGVGAATLPEEEDIPDVDDVRGHADYLTNREQFEDEWAEWLVSKGDADTKEEALVMVRENPMFSGGGRVKANIGLFAGQMGGMNQRMNPMNQMNQGLGAPNLGSRSMGMTPGTGGGGGQDPRMAQMMQQQRGPRTAALPKESEDTELIQLIKMLTSLGIPMEQLRGRTKEELVEMLVSVKGKMGGQERPEVEEEVVEEEVVRAADGGRIGLFKGAQGETKEGKSMSPGTSADYSPGQGHRETRETAGAPPGITTSPIPPITPQRDGIFSKIGDWYKKNIYDNTDRNLTRRMKHIRTLHPNQIQNLISQGLLEYIPTDEAQPYGVERLQDIRPTNLLSSRDSLGTLQNEFGYTGGLLGTGTGGGGASSHINQFGAGTGTGTTTPSGDEYYKFAEWDDWLMPGETTTEAMMPGGYKKEILANTGGLMRTGYAMGTEHPIIPSKDGKQLDMRDTGGYQPHGKAEKHDDVRALLAQGEFVMTSDAVKGMGGGDREVGAKKMYNLMHNMEAMA